MGFRKLERRVECLENVLIELALHKDRCKYVYQSDLKEVLLKRRLLKERSFLAKVGVNGK